MTRWFSQPFTHIKRGVTSLFVCFIAVLPILLFGYWAYSSAQAVASRHKSHAAVASPIQTVQRMNTQITTVDF